MAIDANKTIVLVTGANKSIGFEIVKALLNTSPTFPSSGDDVGPYHVYLGSRDFERGKRAAASLSVENGSSVSVLQLDITSATSIGSAVSTVQADAGRVDVLINNAGIVSKLADRVTRLRDVLETNVVSTLAMSDAFVPLLLTRPAQGNKIKRIINVTSGLGSIAWRGDPTNDYYSLLASEYRVSKAALNMMSVCQLVELKESDVKVFAFDPGYTVTELSGPVELRRQQGAWEAEVPGAYCVKIVAGERDDDSGKMIGLDGDVIPW
ncbi:hypothetical protein BJ170DRAFT_486531 [Xylariales sp. AK1849]|nr:hypothetical protein BJ170DRAFT_486531 [Xylariales sp. AK1849]